MLSTSCREVVGAVLGAVVGIAIPILLHIQVARVGDAEAWGMPLAVFSLPGFFVGAVIGAKLARKRGR